MRVSQKLLVLTVRMGEQCAAWIAAKAKELWRKDSAPKKRSSDGTEAALLSIRIPAARSKLVFFLFVAGFLSVMGRAFYLQCGIETDFLQRQGEIRYARTLPEPATRGQIVDRNGVVLASTIPARSIWINPKESLSQITPDQMRKLAKLLGERYGDLRKRLYAKRNKSFAYIARQINVDTAQKIEALGISGLTVNNAVRRNYPEGKFSAHVVGFTDQDNRGREGVELANNSVLSGKAGSRRVIRDRMGRIVEDIWVREAQSGNDVVLSIDSRLQFVAHVALSKAIEKHQASAGAVVVADVQTGEILAMSNLPTYDPNSRRKLRLENVRNRVLTDAYEPGSTMKPFVVAKALDIGIVRSDTLVQTSPGKLTIGDKTIGDTYDHGLITVSEVISKSSNIGTSKIALEMPAEMLWQMYDVLGFGHSPKIGFPGAASGILRNGKKWRPIEQATISYGHGISVTLMQMVRAYTSLARNGDVIDLTFKRTDRPAQGIQVFRPEVARQMRQMMMNTVKDGGTARLVSVPGFTVAGKTGTANKIENGKYVDKFVASFIGMAPATQPRLIVAVMIDNPTKGSHYGGTISAPVFNEVMESALRFKGIHPDDHDASSSAGILVRGIRND
ncbi:MAG TPA: cell division protein [Sutterella sp.]|nr:cell division protein [Sutterella sp.]